MRSESLKTTLIILLLTFFFSTTSSLFAANQRTTKRPKLILDADTANEIDDLYAILYTLKQKKFDVLGLTSAQWFHYLGTPESVEASQKLNADLVKLLGRKNLPIPLGAKRPMGRPWGGFQPKDSAAAQFIIKQALAMPKDEKLTLLSIGACTNLASAIALKPEIASKIKAYQMGFQYDHKTGVWNKSEFNVRRDLNAADFLLNQKDLELHIMTGTTSQVFKFEQKDSYARQAKMGSLGDYLTMHWNKRFPTHKKWTMWDVAAILAIVNPELAKEEQVLTPPENRQRKVWVFYSIDVDKMKTEFWKKAMSVP